RKRRWRYAQPCVARSPHFRGAPRAGSIDNNRSQMIVAVVVALVALLLPVRLTAGWLEGSAMPSDALMAGVWTLKVALGATAVALGWLSRVGWSREAAGRTPVPEASVPSTGLQGGLTAISPGTLALILVV